MAKRTATMTKEEALAKLAKERFAALVIMLVLILIFAVASVVMWVLTPDGSAEDPPSTDGGPFSVETVTLEGNTKYLTESVIGESGILVGQSIFEVNSNEVEEHLLLTFPYYATVEVQTLQMKHVKITVTETDVIGVVYADGYYVPVGANGKALEQREITSDRPDELYIIGSTPPEGGVKVGGAAMDDYSAALLSEMLSALRRHEMTEIVEIDMTSFNDLKMNWRDQIEIRLGNNSNLDHEIAVAADTIPQILKSRGQYASGVLNLTSYSNDALENQAVFTPSSLIPTTTTASRRVSPSDQTTVPETEPTDITTGE